MQEISLAMGKSDVNHVRAKDSFPLKKLRSKENLRLLVIALPNLEVIQANSGGHKRSVAQILLLMLAFPCKQLVVVPCFYLLVKLLNLIL